MRTQKPWPSVWGSLISVEIGLGWIFALTPPPASVQISSRAESLPRFGGHKRERERDGVQEGREGYSTCKQVWAKLYLGRKFFCFFLPKYDLSLYSMHHGFTRGCIVPNLVDIGSLVLEMKNFKCWYRQYFFTMSLLVYMNMYFPARIFTWLSLLKKELECHLSKDVLCQIWLKLDKWFWRVKWFKSFDVLLIYFYYLSLESVEEWLSIFRNLNHLYSRGRFVPSLGGSAQVTLELNICKWHQIFLAIMVLSPLEKRVT